MISTQDDFRRPILYGVIAHFFKMSDLFDICPIRAINKRKGTLRSFRVLAVRTEQIILGERETADETAFRANR